MTFPRTHASHLPRALSRAVSTSTSSVRHEFLSFFEKNDHKVLASSPVVPENDPTMLFTSAGMVPYKQVFLGNQMLDASRATTSQRCIRAGGKHNDLDNVGFTPRHHTFFEMLGNFSFGDYFKEEAMAYSWTFLTKELGLSSERLRVTHLDSDLESRRLWKAVTGLPDDQIVGLGAEDNFWTMGDGPGIPCGPSGEIFFDLGDSLSNPDDRWLEIWNIVFMQNTQTSTPNEYQPLPRPSIDTGMGLERIASVLQGVYNNYDTDMLRFLVERVHDLVQQQGKSDVQCTGPRELTGRNFITTEPYRPPSPYECALRVIADHLRSSSFMIADGVSPSNVGRGYVLRRIIRRAVGFGFQQGMRGPFLHQLVPDLVASFTIDHGGAHPHPDLLEHIDAVKAIIASEEEIFFRTIDKGVRRLDAYFEKHASTSDAVDPHVAFQLYDTFGFPLDLVDIFAKARGMHVDIPAAKQLMDDLQRSASATNADDVTCMFSCSAAMDAPLITQATSSHAQLGRSPHFVGYESLVEASAQVVCMGHFTLDEDVQGGNGGPAIARGFCVVDPCPFYAESGGQVGDRGTLTFSPFVDGSDPITAKVVHTHKPTSDSSVLELEVDVTPWIDQLGGDSDVDLDDFLKEHGLDIGASVHAQVDEHFRRTTSIHHTATHLLHAALRKHLGEHVVQAGSLVESDRLRFDFSYPRALTKEQIQAIEKTVNEMAIQNFPIHTEDDVHIADAKNHGALMLFGEKYGEYVRVVKVLDKYGDDEPTNHVSAELCGGTHCDTSLEAYPFKVVSEVSVAAGTRRIEALAGEAATRWLESKNDLLDEVAQTLRLKHEDQISPRIDQLRTELKSSEKMVDQLQQLLVKAPAHPMRVFGEDQLWVHESDALVVTPGSSGKKKKEDPNSKMALYRGRYLTEHHPKVVHLLVQGNRVSLTTDNSVTGVHVGKVLNKALRSLAGRGGGGNGFASGVAPEDKVQQVPEAVWGVMREVEA